nr:AraC family transcriptional regulator [uncultured Enterobacter sp.]
MDPLSELLTLLKPQNYASGGVALTANQSIQWPEHAGIKCYAVVSGQCWLTVEGVTQAVRLTAGECYLLPPGPAFSLATDRQAEAEDFATLKAAGRLSKAIDLCGDDECLLVGGHFVLTGRHADMLLSSLPPIVHLQKAADKTAMRGSLDRMVEELRNPQPGGTLIVQQLAYMLLIQALRLHLRDREKGNGLLFALADKQLSAAIGCIHDRPGHAWTLQTLAAAAGMSRSAFAGHFKAVVNDSPMEYLTRWRMLLASERLKSSDDAIVHIASSLGYASESAFSKAFKRVTGSTPGQCRREG